MINRRNLLTATVSAAVGAVVGVGGDARGIAEAAGDLWSGMPTGSVVFWFYETIEPGDWRNHPAWPRIVDSSGATPTG